MTIQLIAFGLAAIVLVTSVALVRQGRVREKYAPQWILLGLSSVVLGIFPGLLDWIADLIGIADPPNLLAFLGIWFLITVVVHLTVEVNKLEERVRVLAEEIALLKANQLKADQLKANQPRPPKPNGTV